MTRELEQVDDGELAAQSLARVADVRARVLAEVERAALADWLPPAGGGAA